ncbi:hypothetical protein Nepgr_025262 [Nepenthes gracilis]|uniref:Uncharacterized protein n=1 Tax=Nepenthes gracilis TaxID=150966 RepID=A0AAD3T6K3_NEPGR|nr:hypothetical protein Nepgr_025262 [Nepenthes gracilis]
MVKQNRETQERRAGYLAGIAEEKPPYHTKGIHLLLEGSKRDVEDRIVSHNIDADDSDMEVKSDKEIFSLSYIVWHVEFTVLNAFLASVI